MKFNELKLEKNILKALKEAGYYRADAHSAAGDTAGARGPRPDGLRPDRHGQDLCVRSADHPAPGKERGQKGHHPCAHPHADARACAADLRKRVPVRALHAVQCGGHLRRRIAGAAGRGDRTRCGYSHCHAGPSVGSDGPEDRKAGQGRVFRARRGRPHARYGLFPGCQAHRQVPAEKAPDPAVLGDHSGRDCRSGRENAA